MTNIKIKGFKIWRDKKTGRMYCYHRKTRFPIDLQKHPLGSDGFIAEVAHIRAIQDKLDLEKAAPNTLGFLFQNYFDDDHFKSLADNTRRDYQKCAGYLDDIRDMPVRFITTPFCQKLINKLHEKHGFKWANYTRTFLSEVFRINRPEGHIDQNYIDGTIKKKRPKDLPDKNRNWQWKEIAFVFENGKPHIVQALVLMFWTGLDPTDAIELEKTQIEGGVIYRNRNKSGGDGAIPISEHLQQTIEQIPPHEHLQLLISSKGEPWAYDGLSTGWHRERARLIKLSKDNPQLYNGEVLAKDLTFKGLRHTLATIIREEGFDERAIADVLGQKTTSMPRHYSKNARLARKNKKTMKAVNKAFERDSNLSNRSKKVSKSRNSKSQKGENNE